MLSTSGETRTDFYVPYTAILTSDRANFYLLCPELNFKPVCGHDCLRSLNAFASHTHVMALARFWTLRRNSKNPLTVICRNHRQIDFTQLGALLAFPGSSSPRILFRLSPALDPAPHALLGTAEPPRKPARGEPQAGRPAGPAAVAGKGRAAAAAGEASAAARAAGALCRHRGPAAPRLPLRADAAARRRLRGPWARGLSGEARLVPAPAAPADTERGSWGDVWAPVWGFFHVEYKVGTILSWQLKHPKKESVE